MRPSEKRSLFIMLSSVEQLVGNIKSMLVTAEPTTNVPRGTNGGSRSDVSYLSDEEDKELEEKMEMERLALIKADENRVQRAWEEDEIDLS